MAGAVAGTVVVTGVGRVVVGRGRVVVVAAGRRVVGGAVVGRPVVDGTAPLVDPDPHAATVAISPATTAATSTDRRAVPGRGSCRTGSTRRVCRTDTGSRPPGRPRGSATAPTVAGVNVAQVAPRPEVSDAVHQPIRSRRRPTPLVVAAVAAVVALALAGCSGGHSRVATAPRPTVAATTTLARPTTTRRRPAPTSTTTSTSLAPTTTLPPSTLPAPAPAQVVAPTAPPATAAPAQLVDQLADTGGASKIITVDSPSWSSTTATFTGWERRGSAWVPVLGPWTANVGYAGWSWTPGEATGRSPIGSFTFGVGFGTAGNPGYRLGWFPITPTDYWVEDPAAGKAYNTHQQGPASGKGVPWGHYEHLIDYADAYQYAALINFNVPVTGSGRGSGIFLHESNGGSTAGCVSLPRDQLVAALRWIDGSTRIVMAPDDTIRTL